ncbi:MAG: tyrosine-type recombinase/integrase [Nitrospirota bacterium]
MAALNTGLRQGELLPLTKTDVHWQTGLLTVSRTKGGKSRRVPMTRWYKISSSVEASEPGTDE